MIQPLKSLIDSIQLRVTCGVIDQRYDELVPLATSSQNFDDPAMRIGEVKIQNCNFRWPENEKNIPEEESRGFVLDDVNLHIEPQEFVIVVGSVGSGKTSLVLGIMQELEYDCSHKSAQLILSKRGKIAYVP